ncbi:MAG: ATP-binding protein [Anaeromyxobacteraceae bacterium]
MTPCVLDAPRTRWARWYGASLYHRTLTAVVAVTFAFCLAVTLASYLVSRSLVRESIDERLDAQAQLVARDVEHELREAYEDLESLSRSALLTNALLDSQGRDRYATPFLREFKTSAWTTVRLALCDFRGRPLASGERTPSFVAGPWVEDVIGRGAVHADLHESPTPHLFVAFPVLYPGTGAPEGALVAEIDLAPLFAEARTARPGGAERLASAAGDLGLGTSGGWDGRISRRRALSLPAPLLRLGLTVEAGVPRADAFRPLRVVALAHAAAALLALVLAAVFARVLAGRLARPVQLLADTAARITGGRALGARVPALGDDEVGRLGAAFNAMLERVEAVTAAEQRHEIAERRRAEAALHVAVAAVERSSDALVVLTSDGRVAFANEAAGRMGKEPGAALTGRPVWEVAPGLDEATWGREWDEVRASGNVLRERTVHAPGGALTSIEVAATYLAFDGGEYCIVAVRDVSARKQGEAAARLAAIGTLAAGTAHEINNPLAFVAANLTYVEEELAARIASSPGAAQPEELLEAVREAREGADRVREIDQALRMFAGRHDSDARAPVDVRRSVEAALVMARGELKQRARVVTRLGDHLPAVLAPGHRLEQVWLNLLINAAQAIEPGATGENEVSIAAWASGGDVVVEVKDSGCGMSAAVKARLFEPFFTTKPVGAGTGLGLSLCHAIVASMGGRIEVESEPGEGTVFRVVLPVADTTAAEPAPSALLRDALAQPPARA